MPPSQPETGPRPISGDRRECLGQERKEQFTSLSGIPIERLYTAANLAGVDAEADIGYPGEYPFTRGVYPTLYRGRLWTMRQYAGFGSAVESNRRYRYLLAQGQTGREVDNGWDRHSCLPSTL